MIEIQIVPSDIRRNVRYVFMDRRRVMTAICVLTVVLAAIVGSMAAAPTVIRKVYKDNYVKSMRVESDIQRERLRENVVQMTSLERSLEDHRVRVEKLITIYGLEHNLGQGGFSFPLQRKDGGDLQLGDAQHREAALRHAMQRLQQQLDLLGQYEAANATMMRISPFTRASDFHKGLDLSAPTGTPVYAAADGIVSFAGQYPLRESVNWWRFGNVVVINHLGHFVTIYGHCDSLKVHRGQDVKQGQVIATVGSTGWSTNSHLHYEVRSDLEQPGNYIAIDPRIYILNYQWTNEANLLMRSRTSKEYKDFDPLPPSFTGKGEVVRMRSKGRGRRRA